MIRGETSGSGLNGGTTLGREQSNHYTAIIFIRATLRNVAAMIMYVVPSQCGIVNAGLIFSVGQYTDGPNQENRNEIR